MRRQFILGVLLLLSVISQVVAGSRESDSLALVAIYQKGGGSDWHHKENWLSNEPIDKWDGVNVKDNRVYKLDLFGNNVSGLAPEIGTLDALYWLNVANNYMGAMPQEIDNLKELFYCDLSANSLKTLPVTFSGCTKLYNLNISNNELDSISIKFEVLDSLTQLKLSNNTLKVFPENIRYAKNLKYLFCEFNQLTSLPTTIGDLKSLEYLNLSNNLLTSLPVEMGKIVNLKDLCLSKNAITDLPSEIGDLFNLYRISLDYNQLNELPTELGNLVDLSVLEVSYNNLSRVSDTIVAIEELSVLTAEYNSLTFEAIEAIMKVTAEKPVFNFDYSPQCSLGVAKSIIVEEGETCSLLVNCGGDSTHYSWFRDGVELPNTDSPIIFFSNVTSAECGEYVCKMTNVLANKLTLYSHIQEVRLQGQENADSLTLVTIYNKANGANWSKKENWLSDKPIGEWQGVRTNAAGNVTGLDLSNRNLQTVPDEIGDLFYLDTLSLEGAVLSALPATIGNLSNLQYLHLGFTQLAALPQEISGLTKLEFLNISATKLTEFPLPVCGLSSCTYLDFSLTAIGEFPAEIGTMTNLTGITASFSTIDSIPSAIGNCRKLKSLFLNGNSIRRIPESIQSLKSLEVLDLADNKLEFLPDDIGELSQLQRLVLSGNQLSSLNHNLMNLTNLKSLFVQKNRLTFGELEFVADSMSSQLTQFSYKDQASLGTPAVFKIKENESCTLRVACGGEETVYDWKKDGTPLGVNDSLLIVDDFSHNDSGYYGCTMTNAKLPDVTLESFLIQLKMDESTALDFKSLIENAMDFQIAPHCNPVHKSQESEVSFYLQDSLKGQGTFYLFDVTGDCVYQTEYNSSATEKLTWNLCNDDGTRVASGSYMAILVLTTPRNNTCIVKCLVGIKD